MLIVLNKPFAVIFLNKRFLIFSYVTTVTYYPSYPITQHPWFCPVCALWEICMNRKTTIFIVKIHFGILPPQLKKFEIHNPTFLATSDGRQFRIYNISFFSPIYPLPLKHPHMYYPQRIQLCKRHYSPNNVNEVSSLVKSLNSRSLVIIGWFIMSLQET